MEVGELISSTSFLKIIANAGVACFHVSTGDVEDAPALDPLAKFQVIEKNGGVYVKGDESAVKGQRGKLNLKCSAKGNEKVLVIGGCVWYRSYGGIWS